MFLFMFTTACIAVACYALWLLGKEYFLPSPLDNLPGPARTSLLCGNILQLNDKRDSWKYFQHLSELYGPTSKVTGFLGMRIIQTYDPKALHSILVKDVDSYRKSLSSTDDLPLLLGRGLFTTEGGQHRKQRKALNPAFATINLRAVTHLFYEIAHKVTRAMTSRLDDANGSGVDVNGWISRTTLEMIGQAGLGYSFDNFMHDSADSYGSSLKMFIPVFGRVPTFSFVVPTASSILPESLIRALLRVFPHQDFRRLMAISDTMRRRSQEIVNEKKKALLKGNKDLVERIGGGRDIMSLLLKANMLATNAEKLSDDELIAQMSTFIVAGMDTTSNALSRILHLLAEHPDVQDKLRREIMASRSSTDGVDLDVPYDALIKLPYLDAVCRETLRVYAPVTLTMRVAARDVLLPLSSPVCGRDGSVMAEIPVPRGTWILVDCQGSNSNKAVWGEDAYEWRPERWLGPVPKAVEAAHIPGVYSSLMTFLGGGHACIGFRFSQLEMKVVLSILLSAFSFELADKPIAWKWSFISYPTMSEEGTKPEMFLKVKRL